MSSACNSLKKVPWPVNILVRCNLSIFTSFFLNLQAVGGNCSMLKKFALDSECIQTEGVLAIAQGCPQLQMLRLQCVNVSDEALQAVGHNCILLETLALFSFQKFTDR